MKKCPREKMVYIYVLELEEDKWYVGKSEKTLKRIEEHFQCDKGGYRARRKWIRISSGQTNWNS